MEESSQKKKEIVQSYFFSCQFCGSVESKLYQNNTCQKCLVKKFKKLIPIINTIRLTSK